MQPYVVRQGKVLVFSVLTLSLFLERHEHDPEVMLTVYLGICPCGLPQQRCAYRLSHRVQNRLFKLGVNGWHKPSPDVPIVTGKPRWSWASRGATEHSLVRPRVAKSLLSFLFQLSVSVQRRQKSPPLRDRHCSAATQMPKLYTFHSQSRLRETRVRGCFKW